MDEKLKTIVCSVLDEMGMELVELQLNRSKRSSLRVFVWKEGGIRVDDCTEISRKLSDVLDREDLIDGRYILEVSSSGVDRPLRSRRDFERQIGRLIKAKVADERGEIVVEGRVAAVDNVSIELQTQEGAVSMMLDKILTARVMVEL